MRVSRLQAASLVLIAAAFVAALFYERGRDGAQAQEIGRLKAQLADDARLRSENESLKRRAAEDAAGAESAKFALGGAPAPGAAGRLRGEGRQSAPLAAGLVPVLSAANRGRATAKAALATQFWAARTGDVALEAQSIALSPESRAQLRSLASSLPESVRDQYNTPEFLVAYMLAGSPHPVGGFEITGETDVDASNVMLDTKWQYVDDAVVHQNTVHLQLGSDGWRVVMPPALVKRAIANLSLGLPPAPAPR